MRLRLLPPDAAKASQPSAPPATCFCSLLRCTPEGAANCRRTIRMLSQRGDAKWGPHQMTCLAGLREAAVPVIVDGTHVATLVMGGARDGGPDMRNFTRLTRQLALTLPKSALAKLRRAYFQTPEMGETQFHCVVELLSLHAEWIGRGAREEWLRAKPSEPRMVRAAKEFVRLNLALHSLVTASAAHVGVSGNHLSRLFKAATGMTLMDYITRRRIEEAEEMLATDEAKIIEVAAAAGFQTLSQFNRAFKAHTGRTPKAFREGNQGAWKAPDAATA
jgi:AraC-like DNA-binding protein